MVERLPRYLTASYDCDERRVHDTWIRLVGEFMRGKPEAFGFTEGGLAVLSQVRSALMADPPSQEELEDRIREALRAAESSDHRLDEIWAEYADDDDSSLPSVADDGRLSEADTSGKDA